MEGFGPAKAALKEDAVPTIFSYAPAHKRRRYSELRESRRHRDELLNSLLEDPITVTEPLDSPQIEDSMSEIAIEGEPSSRTVDVGVQCGK